jgi:hypothetical protein
MKTGAEIVDYKSFVSQNKNSIEDFEKLKGRQIADTVNTNHEIFDDEIDEIDNETPQEDEITPDELVINGGTNIKHYHSYPYGIGTAPNVNRDNGVSKVKRFIDFSGSGDT